MHSFEAASITLAPAPAAAAAATLVSRNLSFYFSETHMQEIMELRRQQGAQMLAGCEQGPSIG